jgi:hypothetical protein
MILCTNCGVELEDGIKTCPLCGKDPHGKSESEPSSFSYPSDIMHLQKRETRQYLWELSGIVAFSAIAVCTIVNLIVNKEVSWSLYCDASIAASWLILSLFLHYYKRPLLMMPGIMVSILLGLLITDLASNGLSWFFPVGMPITVSVFASAGIIMLLYNAASLKGLNIIAVGLIVLSGFLIVLETILDSHIYGEVTLRWSLITAISLLPVILILFFYHYRLKKGKRLDSYFHI